MDRPMPASFNKIPVEKLTSLDLGKATGDPLGEWAVVKAALVSGVSGELKTNKAFSLKGHRHCLVALGHAFEFDGVARSGTLSLTEKSWLVLQLLKLTGFCVIKQESRMHDYLLEKALCVFPPIYTQKRLA